MQVLFLHLRSSKMADFLFDTDGDRMSPITKEAVEAARDRSPKRICFTDKHKFALKPYEHGEYAGAFNVPFGDGFSKVFPYPLFVDKRPNHEGRFWRYIENKEEFDEIEAWVRQQGERVFLRDCLYTSIAMSQNFTGGDESRRTEIGEIVYQTKPHQNEAAIKRLVKYCSDTIEDIPLYKDADLICAIPPKPDKDFDLPSIVVHNVSSMVRKDDITSHFKFSNTQNVSLKSVSINRKWSAWESAQLVFSGLDITDKNIVLIDDIYQSGTTIQYVAMKLQEAGAYRVYGLSMVKTMRDTDNQ